MATRLSEIMSSDEQVAYLRAMMGSLLEGICIINQEFEVVEANQGFADMLGYSMEELMKLHVWDWDAQFTEQQLREEFAHLETTRRTFRTLHRRKNGETYHAEINAGGTMINGQAMVFTFVRNISTRVQIENELTEFKNALDQTHDCVFMFDADTLKFTYVNQGAIEQDGYTKEQLLQMHPYDLKPDFDEQSFREMIAPMIEGKTLYHNFETRHRHKNGHDTIVSIFLQIIHSAEGSDKFIATVRDITAIRETQAELDESNKKLMEMANTDPLSRIPNRRAYEKRLEQELHSAQRTGETLSLMILDIDHFKSYNDTYGHENGDVLLARVAMQLKQSLPRKTDFVARYGGEEFVMLLPYTHLEKAEAVAKKILEDIAALQIQHAGSEYNDILTASIGISSTDGGPGRLFVDADNALYQAKRNGRNRYEAYTG